MLNKSRFSVKDLVNAGMFSALIIGVFWCCGMIGFIPVLMPFVPFLGAFCSAPVFMLYTSRIDKPGMIGILGCLFMLVFSLSGHGLFVIPVVIVLSIISEIILYTGKYKSIIHARLAYTCKAGLYGIYGKFGRTACSDIYIKRILQAVSYCK